MDDSNRAGGLRIQSPPCEFMRRIILRIKSRQQNVLWVMGNNVEHGGGKKDEY